MFENTAIRQTVVKPILRGMDCDPMGQNPLPDLSSPAVHRQLLGKGEVIRNAVIRILSAQGYDGNAAWFYKGAKMCLMWPAWLAAFPSARWIIVRRKDEDIVHSCLKTGFMRKHSDAEGWMGWVQEHKQRFGEMKRAGMDVREVWPQLMVNGDLREIKAAVEEMGLQWRKKEVIEFITPALWSSGKLQETLIREGIPVTKETSDGE
jgi:hypothetical protein